MKDIILTTDLYHQHADPNDHWNLATMFSLANMGLIRFAGIMCDDDRALKDDGSFLHFGDPSVQSIAQMNYITGMAVPVGFGSRKPIRCEGDIDELIRNKKKISSVTLLLDTLQNTKNKVDIHMCGSCKDVLIAYRYAPELFHKNCNCIYLNAGTYAKQEPIEYNVSLEPYAYSQIFKIPCTIRWSPCFDELRHWPYIPSKRANFYEIYQDDIVPYMPSSVKKYFNYMYGKVFDKNWLTYLKEPVDEALLDSWRKAEREMWSTPGYLMSAGKSVNSQGEIVEAGSPDGIFDYKPVNVRCSTDGKIQWENTDDSNILMFENTDPQIYNKAMGQAVKSLICALPEI